MLQVPKCFLRGRIQIDDPEIAIGNHDNKLLGDNTVPNTDKFNRYFGVSRFAGRSYYGENGGLTPTYNGTTTMNATNQVGQSSWFYYLTRSGTSQIGFVTADEFDNGNDLNNPSQGNDGYWGFVRVNNTDPSAPFYDPTSPFAGKYVLSFTLPAFDQRTTPAGRPASSAR